MITYIAISIVLVLLQVSFANLLSFGYSALFPFLLLPAILLYLDLPRPLWYTVVTSGLMLDLFSSLKFGNFLFIYLAIFLFPSPLFKTTDELLRRTRSLFFVFIASVILQYAMLHSPHLSLAVLSWPLLITGIINTLAFYLVLLLTKRLITNG